MGIPKFLGGTRLLISEKTVQPGEEPVESRRLSDDRPDRVVDEPRLFVIRTHAYTICAVVVILSPESIALPGVDIPLQNAGMVGEVVSLCGHFSV